MPPTRRSPASYRRPGRDALRKSLLETQISNFNISLAVTDRFMEALAADGEYELIHPRSGEIVKRLRARDVFDRMVQAAWETGDPGIVFIDRINAGPANPVPEMGPVEATNPCGEQPLYPNEACNLGSSISHGSCGRAECRCTAMAAACGVEAIDWERSSGPFDPRSASSTTSSRSIPYPGHVHRPGGEGAIAASASG